MNSDQLGKQITNFINWAVGSPFAFLRWICAAILTVVAVTHLLPLVGVSFVHPIGDPIRLAYVAGIVWASSKV